MTITHLLEHWLAEPSIANNIIARRDSPNRVACFEPIPQDMRPELAEAIQAAGIKALYSHQIEAWRLVHTGKSIVVTTGTASGKTMCYNLPVMNRLLRDGQSRALYLFPTKALSQDQAQTINILCHSNHACPLLLSCGIYDGDTPSRERQGIRANARIILSNPDMLHTGILPHHTAWVDFFSNLQFIVIDEIHSYRGIFGSHVANVIRRLKRIAHHYGSHPIFILTSASISNPTEHAKMLIETDVHLIENDGSSRGSQIFLIYNPPIINHELGLRASPFIEAMRLAGDLLSYDIQTIIFGRSRKSVELLLTHLKQQHIKTVKHTRRLNDTSQLIRSYRSGYLPKQRREIEQGLRHGEIRTVVATNALELGINIGEMQAALLVGYPGTISATLQQAGRAGRSEEESLAIMVATPDPLDQFLVCNPDFIFNRSPEKALVNPDNLLILLSHIRCAAFELPFQEGDRFGNLDENATLDFLEVLVSQGILYKSNKKFYWMVDQYPAQLLSLRTASPVNVLLQEQTNGKISTLGFVDKPSAHWMVHPEAIYFHEGRTFFVEELDLQENIARLHPVETDYYTEPRNHTTVTLIEKYQEAERACCFDKGLEIGYGEIKISTQVIGYRKIKWLTHENIGLGEVNLPAVELQTTAYWLSLTEQIINLLREQGIWQSDPIDYGSNWKSQRDIARVRDNFRCQVCGAVEQERERDIHHKTPFRTFTSYSQANKIENLITLCPNCHRQVETAVRIRSGITGLGYILRHIAPLFLMCDTRDIGVHCESQSPLTSGQPIVLLYEQVPAGIGYSQQLFDMHDQLMVAAHELVINCSCSDGCPSCVGPGGELGMGGKEETRAILAMLSQMVIK